MTEQMFISPEIMAWVQARAGLDESSLAKKMGVDSDCLTKWKQGLEPMTFGQIKKLAEKTHTPLGYLFAEKPRVETLPIPDFRTFGDHDSIGAQPSVDLLDTIYSTQRRQNWFRDYLLEIGTEPLPFVIKRNIRQDVDEVAASIRDFLQVEADKGIAEHATNREEAMRHLIESVGDKTGILIVRNGVVGNNTSRPLNVKEFRGFALYDEYAPLIFINGRDGKAAQIFTLVHELAHLWRGETGISNLDARTLKNADNIEKFCNKVAAELLVPIEPFLRRWRKDEDPERQIDAIRKELNVSNLVIARRALDSELVSRDWYWNYYETEANRFREETSNRNTREDGGNFYATYFHRVNPRLATAVIVSALEGRMPYRDAHKLLDIPKTETFNKIAKKLGY